MEIAAVIPAHLASKRLSRKVLIKVAGKTILQHVYERVKSADKISSVYIAASDDEIIEEAKRFQADFIKTSSHHDSGTSRVAEAAFKIDAGVIINVQADEPLISPDLLNQMAAQMVKDSSIKILTPVKKIKDKNEIETPDVVKVVFDKDLNALYFSRCEIPYGGEEFYKHIGVYCFSAGFLKEYSGLPESPLEGEERLEQLRFIWNGYKIRVFITEYESIGVDTEEDLNRMKQLLKC